MIEVPAFEKDHVRVFAVNADAPLSGLRQTFLSRVEDEAPAISPEVLADVLGTDAIDPAYVEVFPVTDISELGLSLYLTQALDVREAALNGERARLDALEGSVLIVMSAAFGGRKSTLAPGAALTHIGTYPTENAVQPSAQPLPDPSGAAMPAPKTTDPASGRRIGGRFLAVIVGTALLLSAAIFLALSGEPQ